MACRNMTTGFDKAEQIKNNYDSAFRKRTVNIMQISTN